jgi:hypothetical protein
MGKGIGKPVVAASMPAVRSGGEGKRRGEWGVKRGEMRCHFRERRGHRGGGSARGRWRRRRSVGLPEEEDGRPADRAGLPVSEGEAVGQARPEGGRERGGPWLGRKGEGDVDRGWAGNQKWLDKILSNFIWNLDFW